MDTQFQSNIFYSYLLKGDLNGAIRYIEPFPDQAERYHRYEALFANEEYLTYDADDHLNQILAIYQRYYREVFYLNIPAGQAAENMMNRFAILFHLCDSNDLCETAARAITEAFTARGFHILCGRTGGYFGPYIWKTTESKTFEVELPNGIQAYTVRFLDGFISKSWLDYISFGEVSTGGWTDSDGMISCITSSYDLQSEHFQVSLLKHEAQHAKDLLNYPGMSSEDLEYRAKLVELIYSSRKNLLDQFIQEADESQRSNGHGMAASRITAEFSNYAEPLTVQEIQNTARILFLKSNAEMDSKYHQ